VLRPWEKAEKHLLVLRDQLDFVMIETRIDAATPATRHVSMDGR